MAQLSYKSLIYPISFFFGLFLIFILTSSICLAQQPSNQWAPQARIPVYDDLVEEQSPYLIADQDRVVHAFNAQTLDNARVVVYRQWTLENGWSSPIDIFLSPKGGDIKVLGVFLDSAYIIHIVLKMGGDIYYSNVPLINAGKASAWRTPEMVGKAASSPYNAALAGDDKGNLVIIFAGGEQGKGVYVAYSADAGETWSDPEQVSTTYDDTVVVLGLRVYLGQLGQLHTVWSEVDEQGRGVRGYYARLDLAHRKWSEPIDLDLASGEGAVLQLGILTPAVIEYKGDIFVSYYNGNVNGNWWRRSSDGGQTWSRPVRVSGHHVGTNGALSFVVDSQQTLHAFFGQRINDLSHGMWHTIWQGNGWSDPTPIVSGPQVRDRVGGKGFDPKSPRAVVSQGNVVLVTWVSDGIAGENGAWYSFITLSNTPELPVVMLPTPPHIQPTPLPVPATLPPPLVSTPTPTRPAFANVDYAAPNAANSNPSTPLVLSMGVVLLLIVVVVVIRQLPK